MRQLMRGWLILLAVLLMGFSAYAQSGEALIELDVDAGFDGVYRENLWFPVQVTVGNNGDNLNGRVVVRPERSRGVSGQYVLPLDLPSGSRKTDILYVTADATLTNLVVELLDEGNNVLAEQVIAMRSLLPSDQLYVVLTQSVAGSIDMSGARARGMGASQTNWEVDNLPDNPAALKAVNALVFTDIDTTTLSLRQADTLEAWVAGGGHLIVTGGPNWQMTADGLLDLLPFSPERAETVDDLTPLAAYIANPERLTDETVIAAGTLRDDAQLLVETGSGLPLLARRTIGDGTVDYLTADPNITPLRGWAGLNDLWYTLIVNAAPLPSWSYDFTQWNNASNASEILPGIDVLPSVLPICGFLALYIALIGPVNYVVLNRFNRRELAWVTIPLLIVVFSVLAYVVGGELRGTQPSVGHLTVVRSWPTTDTAHTSEIVGLLSPQRTRYTLTPADDTALRAIPRTGLSATANVLASQFDNSIVIEQNSGFRAADFPVDASFIAGFVGNGLTEAPAIRGQATVFYPPAERNVQVVRGSVRNSSEMTFTDAVILARGQAYRVANPVAPDDVVTFEMTLTGGEQAAAASRVGFERSVVNLGYSYYNTPRDQTARDIMGEDFDPYEYGLRDGFDRTTRQELRRRQLLLTALMPDPFLNDGRADRVYFVGWHDDAPNPVTLAEREYDLYASTLYIVELETAVEYPSTPDVRVSADLFVWSVFEKEGIGSSVPVGFNVAEGNSVAFRYIPVPSARLDVVNELHVMLERTSGGQATIPIQLWNWEQGRWDNESVRDNRLVMYSPRPYIGSDNAVVVRIAGDETISMNLRYVKVEQFGRFD